MRKWGLISVHLVIVILSFMLLAGCQNQNASSATESENEAGLVKAPEITDISATDATESENEADLVKAPEITDISATEKSVVFYNKNGEKLGGKIYVPDGDGKYPVVIMVAGWGGQNSDFKNFAAELAGNGVVAVCYDPIGYCTPTQSDGNGLRTLITLSGGASDIEDIIAALSNQPFIDKDQVYLLGHSMGGLITFYSAVEYQEKIAGYIGLEPSFSMSEAMSEAFPDESQIPDELTTGMWMSGQFAKEIIAFNPYDNMESFNKPVLLLAGTTAGSMGGAAPETLESATDLLPQSELIFIEGADHASITKHSEMYQAVIDFIEKCSNNN